MTHLPPHGQSGSPFPPSWLSRGAGSGGSGDFGGPRALCGSTRGHARAAPPRPWAGMPRTGRVRGGRECRDKSTCEPSLRSLLPFLGVCLPESPVGMSPWPYMAQICQGPSL